MIFSLNYKKNIKTTRSCAFLNSRSLPNCCSEVLPSADRRSSRVVAIKLPHRLQLPVFLMIIVALLYSSHHATINNPTSLIFEISFVYGRFFFLRLSSSSLVGLLPIMCVCWGILFVMDVVARAFFILTNAQTIVKINEWLCTFADCANKKSSLVIN